MFRRGPFRRRPLPRARQALIRANHLKESGNYKEAAEIFERLAIGAQDRGILKRAPHLYLQAAYCHLLSSKTERGIGLMSQGLRLLEETQNWPALHRTGKVAIAELERLGQAQVAEKIKTWLEPILEEHPEASSITLGILSNSEKLSPKLPPKCPFCGATLRSDQVEWIDESTAECLYCGSSVQVDK